MCFKQIVALLLLSVASLWLLTLRHSDYSPQRLSCKEVPLKLVESVKSVEFANPANPT
jgi:hypothetical protein